MAHGDFGATLAREPGDNPPGAVPGSAGRARPDDRCGPGPGCRDGSAGRPTDLSASRRRR